MINPEMICKQCGSVLSAVTFTCVRGEYCKPPHSESDVDEDFASTPHPSVYYANDAND